MGLDANGIRLLLIAKQLGANFQDVVTIGRQAYCLTQDQLSEELSQFNIKCPVDLRLKGKVYSELFFTLLGCRNTQSIDYSDYENATIIHDMNNPLPEKLKGKFSVVVDAGTLEHVFNYPVALKNSMELLDTGGYFISITPANNFMGHGFYQFSPELFFSVFTRENGFDLVKLMVCEHFEDSQWYEVSKPKGGIHGRVTLTNNQPTNLMCIARRLDVRCEPFKKTPQQSDYIESWEQSSQEEISINLSEVKKSGVISTVKGILKSIPGITVFVRKIRYLCKPTFSKRDFTSMDLASYYTAESGSKSNS